MARDNVQVEGGGANTLRQYRQYTRGFSSITGIYQSY